MPWTRTLCWWWWWWKVSGRNAIWMWMWVFRECLRGSISSYEILFYCHTLIVPTIELLKIFQNFSTNVLMKIYPSNTAVDSFRSPSHNTVHFFNITLISMRLIYPLLNTRRSNYLHLITTRSTYLPLINYYSWPTDRIPIVQWWGTHFWILGEFYWLRRNSDVDTTCCLPLSHHTHTRIPLITQTNVDNDEPT